MDKISETFLGLLKAALENRILAYDPGLSGAQWRGLFDMAARHKLGAVIYGALRGSPAEKSIDGGLLSEQRMNTLQTVYSQTARTEEFKTLYARLCGAGLRPCVVKGIVCRSLYPNPESRTSSDEDILVPDGDFIKAHRMLLEYGLEPTEPKDPRTDFEIGYRGRNSALYIELHRCLFAPDSAAYGGLNELFAGVEERLDRQEVCGLDVWTMQPGDNLLYLILHSFKHFLHGGFGLRQVCDIMLYARKYGPLIDWRKLENELESVRAAGFAAAVFAIAAKHLGFEPAAAGMTGCTLMRDTDELSMLEDLLDAGIYGQNIVRQHSSNITLSAVAADMEGKRSGSVLASVFLPYSEMAKKYEFLIKYPVLLPAAWVMRVLKYRKEKSGGEAAQSLKLGRERRELLIKYGVINAPKRRKPYLPVVLLCAAGLLVAALVKLCC